MKKNNKTRALELQLWKLKPCCWIQGDKPTNAREESPETDRDVYFHLIYGRLNSTVQQERMSQLDIDTENKCILDLNLAPYKKVNSRWLVDLHVKWKTMKPLKEKHISAFS